MSRPSSSELDLSTLPRIVCALDLETSGPNAIKPDRANLAVVGLKVYTWDEQQQGYLPGPYEHYAPADFPTLQQRLDALPDPIIGHNLFNFDYLVLRRHLNLERIVEKSVDTLHFLYEQDGGGEDGSLYSLDKLAKENFGEGKTAKASTIPKLLKEGKLAEVLAYNERDCDLTFRIWWKMVSERHISAGEARDDEGELFEVTYDLEDKDISVLTCATPRFTYTTWVEQFERDGWIVMPPRERKRHQEERERQRKEAWEVARARDQVMRESIKQHLRDDIPRKFAQQDLQTSPGLEEARVLLMQAGLPGSVWAEEVVYRLLLGENVHPARVELAGRPDDLEGRAELMKSTLVVLAENGYLPHYHAYNEPDSDSISLAGPPPTLAEQYVDRIRQRYFEMEAIFGSAGIEFEVPHWASNIHPAYTDAMNSLRGDGHVVFEDGSYVLDTDEIGLSKLQPKVLTSEERADLKAYYQDPSSEFTVPWHSGAEDHDMALHRRNYDLSQGAMFHMSCSCGWRSKPSTLEIDARAYGTLHAKEVCRQKDGPLVLRFRDHVLSSSRVRNPRILNQNEDRWIGLCACGWSYIERTEDDADEAFEKHWTALLDDPAMHADYLAFIEEQGLPLPGQTTSIGSAGEIET
jgi:3'-5' exonuclease